MSDKPTLATVYVYPPATDDDTWSVTIEPKDDTQDGAWFEHLTAADAFAHAMKWITDRGLRMTCRIDIYPPARSSSGEPQP